jgi:hypothetical protein|tara:strand:- start:188 stop:388 length:201 start_codon:yes stop_codon:yes gene_type:complete
MSYRSNYYDSLPDEFWETDLSLNNLIISYDMKETTLIKMQRDINQLQQICAIMLDKITALEKNNKK